MKLVAWDTETHPSQPGLAAPPIVCGSIADESGCHLQTRIETLLWLTRSLADPSVHFVGTNIAYDFVCAAAAVPQLLPLIFAAYDADRVHDVGIREALIDIGKGELAERGSDDEMGIRYGATILAKRYLGLDLSEEKKNTNAWRKRYHELEHVPQEKWPWAARVYPLRDVAFPLAIFHKQTGGLNLHHECHETRAALALELMRVRGLRTNGERVALVRSRVETEDRKNLAVFQTHGILRDNGSCNKKVLAQFVTKAYGGDPPKTAKGGVATDRDTLAESGDPILERYAAAGKNNKYLTTYLPILEQGIDVPWNPQFNVLVATTRISSNAQQFPQKGGVRECFEPRPGMVFCSVDYGGLELRTMSERAWLELGFSKMAEALNSGTDTHLVVSASFQNLSYEQARLLYVAAELVAINYRNLGKTWNFSKGGGGGAAALVFSARAGKNGTTTAPDGTVYDGVRFCLMTGAAKHCGAELVEVRVQGKKRRVCLDCVTVAKTLDKGWLNTWTEQAQLFEKASKLFRQHKQLPVTIPVSNVVRGKCGYTQWLNTPFQGLGAAATKRAMYLVSREMYTDRSSPMWGSYLVLNVHDELISEVPLDKPESGDRMAYIMRETLKQYVPHLAKAVEAEPALCMTMNKNAKTLRDANGRLLISA